MKHAMSRLMTVVAALGAMAVTGCEKNAVQDITGAPPGSRIRFFNFGLNAPSVNFYADERKMTAVSSSSGTEAVTGVSYGAVGSAGLYSGLEPRSYAFSARVAATIDKDLAIATVPFTLEDGKAYSLYLSGVYDAVAKRSDAFVVADDFVASVDFLQTYVRFVNGVFNAAPMTLSARNTVTSVESPVGGLVAYKAAGAFVALTPGVYDLGTRVSGGATNAISSTAVSFVAGRVYTISSRGDITIVSTTLANRPLLGISVNR